MKIMKDSSRKFVVEENRGRELKESLGNSS